MRRLPKFAGAAAAATLGLTLVVAPVSAEASSTASVAVSEDSCKEPPASFSADVAPPALALLQAEKTWTRSTGAGITVAVVDSGVNGAEPRLEHALLPGIDLVGGDTQGRTDTFGHGTGIAGAIAAAKSTKSKLVGLAPDAKILPVRVYTDDTKQEREAGRGLQPHRIAQGIRAAADAGAQIINVSISGSFATDDLRQAVAYALSKGSLVIASGGNASSASDLNSDENPEENEATDDVRYPAAFPGVIGVSALSVATDSDIGGQVTDASVHGKHIDLVAPGSLVLTLGLNGGDCVIGRESTVTSYATAYVSAAAALVAAAYPNEGPQKWAFRLEASALRANLDARDDLRGWGTVQPLQAIALTPGPGTRGPENPFYPAVQATATPAPAGITIAGDDGSSAREATRAMYVALIATGALSLAGVAGVFFTRRRRAEREAAATRQPDESSP